MFSPAAREVLLQRIGENTALQTAALSAYSIVGVTQRLIGRRAQAWVAFSQIHRTARSAWLRQTVEPFLLRNHSVAWAPSGPANRPFLQRIIGSRIVVLKPRVSGREKGVVLVKFSESIREIARGMDIERLLNDYHLVLEPSWSGYCDRDLLYYTRFDHPVFVMAAEQHDHRLLQKLASNLIPLEMGPCDWVDPAISEPYLGSPKKYDIVVTSNWKQLKRHYVLFRALTRMRGDLRVALIGGSMDGRTADDVRRLATAYGVLDRLTFFEDISYSEVMRITCSSRISLLLSLKEGSNRAIAESMFCDVPGIVLEEHVGGIRKNIRPQTGRLVPERRLPQAIEEMLAQLDTFGPRAWALENISCTVTTDRLNAAIRTSALAQGEQWTTDIAAKTNRPEIFIVDDSDRSALQAHHSSLADYIRQ